MDDSNVNDVSALIERARLFDQKLAEIRKKVFEPSLLGGGTKARKARATTKTEAENLLESVTKLSETVKRVNAAKVTNMNDILDWNETVSAELEPLEAKGIEAGHIMNNGMDGGINNDTDNDISNCGSYENRTVYSHPGPSRRLFD